MAFSADLFGGKKRDGESREDVSFLGLSQKQTQISHSRSKNCPADKRIVNLFEGHCFVLFLYFFGSNFRRKDIFI